VNDTHGRHDTCRHTVGLGACLWPKWSQWCAKTHGRQCTWQTGVPHRPHDPRSMQTLARSNETHGKAAGHGRPSAMHLEDTWQPRVPPPCALEPTATLFCHACEVDTQKRLCRVRLSSTHGTQCLPSLSLPCPLCRVSAHGRGSAVSKSISTMYFAHTVGNAFPVVLLDGLRQ
jgi:hypothetical protein